MWGRGPAQRKNNKKKKKKKSVTFFYSVLPFTVFSGTPLCHFIVFFVDWHVFCLAPHYYVIAINIENAC
jgi:hypothetical protein